MVIKTTKNYPCVDIVFRDYNTMIVNSVKQRELLDYALMMLDCAEDCLMAYDGDTVNAEGYISNAINEIQDIKRGM